MFVILDITDPFVKLIVFIVIAYVFLKLPIFGKYVSVVNTLFHEVGHALMALLTGGQVEKIELFSNSEGVAWSSNRFWLGRVLTSLAGYPTASATSFLFLYLISKGDYIYVFIILIAVLVFSFIFWIRNLYGLLWVITFTALFTLLALYGSEVLVSNILLIITSIIFVESITTSFDILKLSFSQPTRAGDATSLWKSIIFIPSPIWGVLFFVQSIVFGTLGVSLFL
ncbi:M50 family metallopeptidase [Globicatella sulfidifaciens]|uniref:M50 family metallopeptidase n=1 Tax=Globicatella sulfidifaciens TaxID=136093 RepID=A0A7X8C3I5_9LACT|nr:M50 family metallopeptidase [Globicatella sulfidifaciens]NLJ18295.1 M50 family metallopeptidase [Globicatella sulfidifaciens]